MGATSFLDPKTRQFESGMPILVLWLEILYRGTLVLCCQWLTLPMGNSSSLDLASLTIQFESGMQKLVMQLASLLRGTLRLCYLFLTLLMATTSSLHLQILQFAYGMLRPVLRSENLHRGTLTMSSQRFALLMGSISSLDPMIWRFTGGTHLHTFPPNLLPRLFTPDVQIQKVGSETPWAAYSIGYPQTVVQDSIHLLSSQFLPHILSGHFLFNLKSFHLEPLGPKYPKDRRAHV